MYASKAVEVALDALEEAAPLSAGGTLVFRQTMPHLFVAGEWSKNAHDPENDNYAILGPFWWNSVAMGCSSASLFGHTSCTGSGDRRAIHWSGQAE